MLGRTNKKVHRSNQSLCAQKSEKSWRLQVVVPNPKNLRDCSLRPHQIPLLLKCCRSEVKYHPCQPWPIHDLCQILLIVEMFLKFLNKLFWVIVSLIFKWFNQDCLWVLRPSWSQPYPASSIVICPVGFRVLVYLHRYYWNKMHLRNEQLLAVAQN